jgi:hypothetical protein
MIEHLRSFNSTGAAAYLSLFNESTTSDIPARAYELSIDPGLTTVIVSDLNLEIPRTRLELARSLDPHIGDESENEQEARNPDFWNWLAAHLMKSVIEDSDKVGDRKRWLYTHGSSSEYRHIFASAHQTFSSHKDNLDSVMGLLCQDLGTFGEVLEQVLATRALAGSVGAQLASAIYYDPVSARNKPGSGGSGPGSPRRLVAFLNQIRLTVDIKSMSVKELVDLLPPEFDKFIASSEFGTP